MRLEQREDDGRQKQRVKQNGCESKREVSPLFSSHHCEEFSTEYDQESDIQGYYLLRATFLWLFIKCKGKTSDMKRQPGALDEGDKHLFDFQIKREHLLNSVRQHWIARYPRTVAHVFEAKHTPIVHHDFLGQTSGPTTGLGRMRAWLLNPRTLVRCFRSWIEQKFIATLLRVVGDSWRAAMVLATSLRCSSERPKRSFKFSQRSLKIQ